MPAILPASSRNAWRYAEAVVMRDEGKVNPSTETASVINE